MNRLCRALSLILLLGGLAVLGHEFATTSATGPYRIIPIGELWYKIDANSLVGLQGVIERTSPWLWSTIVQPILIGAPAWVIPLALGVLGLLACRRRRQPGERVPLQQAARHYVLETVAALRSAKTAAPPADHTPTTEPTSVDAPQATMVATGSAGPKRKIEPTVVRRP